MKEKGSFNIIDRYRQRIKPENTRFISKNLDISNQVTDLLKKKGLTQKEFAALLGKQESEVSRWLSGLHNLTLQSIAKMESVLESDIVVTPLIACEKYSGIKYITLKVYGTSNHKDTLKKDQMTELTYDNKANEIVA